MCQYYREQKVAALRLMRPLQAHVSGHVKVVATRSYLAPNPAIHGNIQTLLLPKWNNLPIIICTMKLDGFFTFIISQFTYLLNPIQNCKNNKIVSFGRDLWGSSNENHLFNQDQLEQAVQHSAQLGFLLCKITFSITFPGTEVRLTSL